MQNGFNTKKEDKMGKSRDMKKATKKKPAKTLKEKRKEKREKKNA